MGTLHFMNFPTLSAFSDFIMRNIKIVFPDVHAEKLSNIMEHRHLLKKTNNYGSFLEIQNTSRLNCLKEKFFTISFFESYGEKLK